MAPTKPKIDRKPRVDRNLQLYFILEEYIADRTLCLDAVARIRDLYKQQKND